MKIDYMKVLKETFDFTLKYKALWIFGFFLALFGGGSGGGGGSFGNGFSGGSRGSMSNGYPRSMSGNTERYLDQAQDWFMNLIRQPWFWVMVAVIVVIAILWVIVAIYLSTVSRIALMNAVKHDAEGKPEKITFKKLWAEATPLFWKLFIFQLVYGFLIFFMVLIFVAPILIGILFPLLFCGLILWVPLFIIAMVIVSYVYVFAVRMIVLEKKEMMEAAKDSWKLFKARWLDVIISSLVMILPGIAYGIVMVIGVLVVLGIFVLIPGILLFATKAAIWTIALLILGIFVSLLLISAISAPYEVFKETYWTKIYGLIKA